MRVLAAGVPYHECGASAQLYTIASLRQVELKAQVVQE